MVRQVERLAGGESIITVFFYSQVQYRPAPWKDIQAVIDRYCQREKEE
jgi:hypothetical protein